MNRPPPFSSHSSRESNQRFISATVIFRFTFFLETAWLSPNSGNPMEIILSS